MEVLFIIDNNNLCVKYQNIDMTYSSEDIRGFLTANIKLKIGNNIQLERGKK